MQGRTLLSAVLLCASSAHAAQQITSALDPQQTLERINRNYNTLITANHPCTEPDTGAVRGHHYCSGVTLRMVDDGPFNFWDYSEFAKKLGASSFSWIRSDLSISKLVRPAGFILRTPADARRLNLPVMETGYLCIFSFDGFTGTERQWYGCGLYNQPLPTGAAPTPSATPANRNRDLAFGSCDISDVDTGAQWRAKYRSGIQKGQCSWNAEQPADWDAMIDVHQNPGKQGESWIGKEWLNEFLIRTATDTGDGSARKQHIDALVYDPNTTFVGRTRGDTKAPVPANGLAVARSLQRKLFAQGYAVPVLRMDFQQPAQRRFAYLAEDQAVSLGVTGEIAQTYIQSANWTLRQDPGSRRQEWTLVVVPSAWGKGRQATDQQAIYEELYALRGADSQWRITESSNASMRQQLGCLIKNYPAKTQWNIEPFRPVVSDSQAAKAGCNPY
ncbi:DUF2599 domain-containing protein [Pseudomonas sp. H9]|uniref:DUF2599 domain-containing protein n=1 Tax=Pseudomonas sp. H9 TaxID=483968 RepID=UPI00105837BE|nr:DUF2599 domain-containing protein [Pseudomonas sp. H9]TDF83750.1 DUF2599 domain-containing protein [Pseudomonas sp. H9]